MYLFELQKQTKLSLIVDIIAPVHPNFIFFFTGDSMMDLLWSDPMKDYGEEKISEMFIPNKARQISYHFSYKAVCNFLNHNGLISIVRGHEAQDAGFKMYKPMPKSKFPSLITIFSAPNYCETYGNKAVIMCYEKKNMNLKVLLFLLNYCRTCVNCFLKKFNPP